MGRRSQSGGVIAKGNRIQFDFTLNGQRYRPTINSRPTEVNLRNARKRHQEILRQINHGVFDFAAEFPDYKNLPPSAQNPLFDDVADQWLASIGGLAYATIQTYKRILNGFWRPRLGQREIRTRTKGNRF